MHEILFRGKRIDNGEWVFGSVVHQTDYYGDKCDRWFILEGNSTNDYDIDDPIEVQKETVGQYTGLTDKNGKRIFEGDLLVLAASRTHEVKFADGSFYMEGTTFPFRYGGKFTIIGNIHDNPELLEEVSDNG